MGGGGALVLQPYYCGARGWPSLFIAASKRVVGGFCFLKKGKTEAAWTAWMMGAGKNERRTNERAGERQDARK